MSEERLSEELEAVEAGLASLRPARSRIRRDRLLLLARQILAAPRSRRSVTGLTGSRRAIGWAVGLAAAACLLVALFLPWLRRGETPALPGPNNVPQPPVQLAAGWQVEPTGKADYRVMNAGLIRLPRGELLVESLPLANGGQIRPTIRIETPAGVATAADTKFFIGVHPVGCVKRTADSSVRFTHPALPSESKGTTMTSLTRVLVLAGVVTLANAQGSVTGQANHLLAAEPGKPPVNYALTANSDFAFDLYAELAKENAGKNLFFSPYSMSSVLAMTAEGARGETAAEMGKVLCFPAAARRIGDDAQLIPWNVALIHTGFAALNERFNAPKATSAALPNDIRQKIDGLRKEIEPLKARAAAMYQAARWFEWRVARDKADKLENELRAILSQIDQYELHVANALWAEKTYPFQQSYFDTIHKFYKTGGAFPVEFFGNPEASRQEINAWVEKQTNDRIKDLVPRGVVDANTRLILTNAIYFKGEWAEVFKKDRTKEDDFLLADGGKARVPMMHRGDLRSAGYAAFNGDGTYFDTPHEYRGQQPQLYPDQRGFAMLEMPYKGDDLSMVVIVPQATDGLPILERLLTPASVQAWIGKLQKRQVDAFLPKLKLETSYKMKDALTAMGMGRAFVSPTLPSGADFDGICTSQDPREKLFISQVLHKAFLEVDENGTEAAAATAVVMGKTGAAPAVRVVPTFRADKPFVFLIRDKHTGCILFLGRMVSPKE